MLLTCKILMFSDFAWKKIFCSTKWWGGWHPRLLPPFLYGPEYSKFWNSIRLFKKTILTFIRPFPNKIFKCHYPRARNFFSSFLLSLRCIREPSLNIAFKTFYISFAFAEEMQVKREWYCNSSIERLFPLGSIKNIDTSMS